MAPNAAGMALSLILDFWNLNYERAENYIFSFCWYIIIFFVHTLLEETFSDQFL